jgi:hypothetical protein
MNASLLRQTTSVKNATVLKHLEDISTRRYHTFDTGKDAYFLNKCEDFAFVRHQRTALSRERQSKSGIGAGMGFRVWGMGSGELKFDSYGVGMTSLYMRHI